MDFKSFIKRHPKGEWLFYGALLLLAVLLFLLGGKENGDKQEKVFEAPTENAPDWEQRLEDVLGAVQGAGSVRVLITYEQDEEIVPVYAVDSQVNDASQTKKETPVTLGSGGEEKAMVLTTKTAKVRGALIVAQGADDPAVRSNLLRAAQALLDVPAAKIEVLPMEKQKGGEEK